MLPAFKRFACRADRPLLMLLAFDWRFLLALFGFGATLILGLTFTLKLWKRSPENFPTEIRISALDLVQSWSLARSARSAEARGDLTAAIWSWQRALANDPFNEKLGVALLHACGRSPVPEHKRQALETAAWFDRFSTNGEISGLFIAALEQSKDWPRILQLTARDVRLSDAAGMSRGKALFWTGDYPRAAACLKANSSPLAGMYRAAVNCILADPLSQPKALEAFQSSAPSAATAETIEVSLQVFFQLRDLPRFQRAVDGLSQVTDRTLPFNLLHARLLSELGRRREAAEVASQLPPPSSGEETFRAAHALVRLGFKTDASAYLLRYREKFFDSIAPWILSAELLLDAADKDQLRVLASRLQRSTPALKALIAAVEAYLEMTPTRIQQLRSALGELGVERYPQIWYLATTGAIAAGQPGIAVELLLKLEPHHLSDPDFYIRLFAAGEAAKDASLMRRVAQRRYELAPDDLFSIANQAAMLTIHDEQPELAAQLSARCLEAQPDSIAAQVNHAAALINLERFGSADLILRQIDGSSLHPSASNQILFIKAKRAARLGDLAEARLLAAALDKAVLYSRQREWLAERGL